MSYVWREEIKTPVFLMMDGNNRRGRPYTEWADVEWCGASLQEVSLHLAFDQSNWQKWWSRHRTPTGIEPMANDDDDDGLWCGIVYAYRRIWWRKQRWWQSWIIHILSAWSVSARLKTSCWSLSWLPLDHSTNTWRIRGSYSSYSFTQWQSLP